MNRTRTGCREVWNMQLTCFDITEDGTSNQDREVLALRSFYSDDSDQLTEIDSLLFSDPFEMLVPLDATDEIAAWLTQPKVWLAFHPSIDADGTKTILRLQ